MQSTYEHVNRAEKNTVTSYFNQSESTMGSNGLGGEAVADTVPLTSEEQTASCPGNHVLTHSGVSGAVRGCNVCKQPIWAGEAAMSCRPCDFDVHMEGECGRIHDDTHPSLMLPQERPSRVPIPMIFRHGISLDNMHSLSLFTPDNQLGGTQLLGVHHRCAAPAMCRAGRRHGPREPLCYTPPHVRVV